MARFARIHRLTSSKRRSLDPVPMTALILGAVSFMAPFASLKENRVVDGLSMTGIELASPGIMAFAVLGAFLVVAAAWFLDMGFLRRWIYVIASSGCLTLAALLLVRGGAILGDGAAPRVSPALGFWGLPAAAYILADHAGIYAGRGKRFVLFLFLLLPAALILAGGRSEAVSVVREWAARKERFLDEIAVHLHLCGMAIVSAALIGVWLGIASYGKPRASRAALAFVDGAQTIPSMALFGLLMAPLAAISQAFPALKAAGIGGVGAAPALIALTLYALLPIVRNTVAGLSEVSESALEAGRGLGMSPRQLFFKVRWPLALPYILTGLRTASVQAVGNAAVAALIGAGGLGVFIFQGLGQAAPDLILLGVLPLILMAVLVDRFWNLASRLFVSKGLKATSGMDDQTMSQGTAA